MKLRALVAEDIPSVLNNITETIDRDGRFEVVAKFGNAVQCLEYLRGDRAIDVLFLDVNLYEGSCFDLLGWLVRDNIPIPPVYIITARLKEEFQYDALTRYRKQIYGWVQKPFNVNFSLEREQIYRDVSKQPASAAKLAPARFIAGYYGGIMHVIPTDKIIYVRLEGRGIKTTKALFVYTTLQVEPYAAEVKRLDDMHQLLGETNFARVDRPLIVGLNYVKSPQKGGTPLRYWTSMRGLPEGVELDLSSEGYKRLMRGLGLR